MSFVIINFDENVMGNPGPAGTWDICLIFIEWIQSVNIIRFENIGSNNAGST